MGDHKSREKVEDMEDHRTAMLHALMKTSDQFGAMIQPLQSLNTMGNVEMINDAYAPHRLFSIQTIEQSRFRTLTAGNVGGGADPLQQRFGQLQQTDTFYQMYRHLQQQHDLQLQHQHQLLLQASELAAGTVNGRHVSQMEMIGAHDFSAAAFLDRGDTAADARLYAPLANGSMGILCSRNENQFNSIAPYVNDLSISILAEAPTRRSSQSFPVILHRILTDLEAAGAVHIASFVADGSAFLVRIPKEFEAKVLRRYFPRMGSFGSFQRQLNLYDFKRVAHGVHRGAYAHPLFHRRDLAAAKEMRRIKVKGGRKNGNRHD